MMHTRSTVADSLEDPRWLELPEFFLADPRTAQLNPAAVGHVSVAPQSQLFRLLPAAELSNP